MKRSYLPILIVSVLLLSVATGVNAQPSTPQLSPQSSPTTKGESAQITNQNQAGHPNQSPAVPTISDASKPVPDANQIRSTEATKDSRHLDEEVRIEGKVAHFTGLLVLVGALQFIALIVQAVVFAISLRITNKAADAAKKSAETGRTALILTQRARVQFNNVTFDFSGAEPISMSYWFTNVGQTAAHIKTRESVLVFSTNPPASLYDPTAPKPAKDAPDLAVLGCEESSSGIIEDLEESVIEEVSGISAPDRLWLNGFIAYYDEFEAFHVTVWCRYWPPAHVYNQGAQFVFPKNPGLNYGN